MIPLALAGVTALLIVFLAGRRAQTAPGVQQFREFAGEGPQLRAASPFLAFPPAAISAAFGKERGFFLPAVEDLLRAHRSAIVTSYYRSPRKNADTKGSEVLSQHLAGLALDIVAPEPALVILTARSLQLVAVDEGDHVHVQFARKGVLSARIRLAQALVA